MDNGENYWFWMVLDKRRLRASERGGEIGKPAAGSKLDATNGGGIKSRSEGGRFVACPKCNCVYQYAFLIDSLPPLLVPPWSSSAWSSFTLETRVGNIISMLVIVIINLRRS